jgi:hypothetical protein
LVCKDEVRPAPNNTDLMPRFLQILDILTKKPVGIRSQTYIVVGYDDFIVMLEGIVHDFVVSVTEVTLRVE